MASTDEEDSFEEYQECFCTLKNKVSNEEDFRLSFQELCKEYSNPFELCVACLMIFANDNFRQKSQKKCDFENMILCNFCEFLKNNVDVRNDSSLLTDEIRKNAFKCFMHIRQVGLQKRLIDCFCLRSEILVPIVLAEIEDGVKENHVRAVKNLQLFSINTLLCLLLQNKLVQIEKLLTRGLCRHPGIIYVLIRLLNKIIRTPLTIEDLQRTYDVKGIEVTEPAMEDLCVLRQALQRHVRTFPRGLSKAQIDDAKKTLPYIFKKHYKEKSITLESLMLYVEELSKYSWDLRNLAMTLFISKKDFNAARIYWDKVRSPKAIDHPLLMKYKNSSTEHIHTNNTREEDWYQLHLSAENVVTVEDTEQFTEAMDHLKNCKIISMDAEWKSWVLQDEVVKISVLQLASKEKVYLLDMMKLEVLLGTAHWISLGQLFSNMKIKKLCYGGSSDNTMLRSMNRNLAMYINKMKKCTVDLQNIAGILLKLNPNIFSYKTVDHKGLSGLVFLCFGKALDKLEQCSFWNKRPLTSSQVTYAALDVYCLIEIHNYLNKKLKPLGILHWISVKPETVPLGKPLNLMRLPLRHPTYRDEDRKFVCDSPLRHLGVLLLSKEIDTIIINEKDGHDKCIELFDSENRIVLTNKTVYKKLRLFIPARNIFYLEDVDKNVQLQHVLSYFQISITV